MIRRIVRSGYVFPIFIVVVVLFIIGAVSFMGYRDHRAVQRCHEQGGVTWDTGSHCVLGDFRTINTR